MRRFTLEFETFSESPARNIPQIIIGTNLKSSQWEVGPQATLFLLRNYIITSFRSKYRICSPKKQTDERTLNDEIIGICFNEKRRRSDVLFSRTVDLMMKVIFLNGSRSFFR